MIWLCKSNRAKLLQGSEPASTTYGLVTLNLHIDCSSHQYLTPPNPACLALSTIAHYQLYLWQSSDYVPIHCASVKNNEFLTIWWHLLCIQHISLFLLCSLAGTMWDDLSQWENSTTMLRCALIWCSDCFPFSLTFPTRYTQDLLE